MTDPTPTPRRPEPVAPPTLEVTGPGVYPLETRECPQLHTDGVGPAPNRARIHSSDSIGVVCSVSEENTPSSRVPLRYGEGPKGVALALHDFAGAALHPSVKQWCPDCHGAGRVPDENGPKVEVYESRACSVGCVCGRTLIPERMIHKDDHGRIGYCPRCGDCLNGRYARAPYGIQAFWASPKGLQDRRYVGPHPTPAAAFAAAQRAHEEGKR